MGKIVALVPARAGSTRVKNKNIRQIKGMPLIGIAVKQALDVKEIDEVYISTDSELYAEIAQVYGAVKPFLRPKEIAGNQSTDYEVFRHFLNWYKSEKGEMPELIIQVRATAPVRESDTISAAIRFMKEHREFDSLRSISSPHQTPYKMWTMDENKQLTPLMNTIEQAYDMPTQNLSACFAQDGIVDIVRPETILKFESMAGKKIAGWLDHSQTWDIDTEQDMINAGQMVTRVGLFNLPADEKGLGATLGIVQGRLTKATELQHFPTNWKREFSEARKAGYSSIEWFRDKEYNSENPLWVDSYDLEEVKKVAFIEGIGVQSICDDYVQKCEWKNLKLEQFTLLVDLLVKAASIGVSIVVYPMFEKADITDEENRESFIYFIKKLGNIAEKFSIKIALEISEGAEWQAELLDKVDNNIGICVDTGNLFAKGINAGDIIACEKIRNRIIHIHLKDRNEKGDNVILGTGRVDFYHAIKQLYDMNYSGLMVTETDRGIVPFDTAVQNKLFLQNIISVINEERDRGGKNENNNLGYRRCIN